MKQGAYKPGEIRPPSGEGGESCIAACICQILNSLSKSTDNNSVNLLYFIFLITLLAFDFFPHLVLTLARSITTKKHNFEFQESLISPA